MTAKKWITTLVLRTTLILFILLVALLIMSRSSVIYASPIGVRESRALSKPHPARGAKRNSALVDTAAVVNAALARNSQTNAAPANIAAPANEQTPKGAPATAPAAATTNTLHLLVDSARQWIPSGLAKGQPIPLYHWLIVIDDTGDPSRYGTNLSMGPGNSNFDCTPQSLGGDPLYPANCQWPSIHSVKGGTSAEVFAEGDQTNLNTTIGLNMPNGKYMISVTADGFDIPGCTKTATVTCHVDGFKIDGNWFTVPLSQPGTDPGLVKVDMQPYPLPLLTVRMKVWNDLNTNGAYDVGEPYLAGFEGHIDDIMGIVSQDWFGNPLCTTYQHDANGNLIFGTDGKPVVLAAGGHCISDANGDIKIPYLGPDRYSATVTAPNGQTWYQTTTLEGNHDWDVWSIEGWNGYDPEFIVGGEPFPFAEFGFVQPTYKSGASDTPTTGGTQFTGSLKGTVVVDIPYTPAIGGIPFGGESGNAIGGPVPKPILTLVDTLNNDQLVWVGIGNADGTFQINHIPDGDYVLAYWDVPQEYLIETITVRIANGQLLDLGNLDAFPWFGTIHGKVCFDTNRNGKCDPGEPGIPNLPVQLLSRDNSVMDQGFATVTTDRNGNYNNTEVYPLGQWMVSQAYYEQYYTVGVTYQALNQPTETTVMANGGFVDVSTFTQVGQITRLDWAIHTYETDPNLGPTNGGIVGEMVYNTTRAPEDPRFNGSEDNEPGIPNFKVHLYWPVKCNPATDGSLCVQTTTAFGTNYYMTNADGSYKFGPEANDPYISETWRRPVDCVARDVNMQPVVEQLLPPPTGGHDCLEPPLMGNQVSNNALTDAFGVTGNGQYVNGNYGFTQIITDANGNPTIDPTTGQPGAITIPQGDWLVAVEVPTDPFTGKPLWRASMEEDPNLYDGDKFVAPGETAANPPTPIQPARVQPVPAIPAFPCMGPLHTVHVVDTRAVANFDVTNPSVTSGVYNPSFLGTGGSPYEGQQKPLCNVKMVTVRNGRSATPNFYYQPTNNVPLPGRIQGIVTDDLNLSTNPKELYYGEKFGIPYIPVGIYDFTNRLVRTIHTDFNGTFETLLPSTTTYNCPNPSGICPGVYRFVANDPGQPGQLNTDYNPQYRTIGIFFQVWPGITLYNDLAPIPIATGIEGPSTQNAHPAQCLVNDPTTTAPKVPELFSVSRPYVTSSQSGAARRITINGQYFGATRGTGSVTLDGTQITAGPTALAGNYVSWHDTQIVFTAPSASTTFTPGPHELRITSGNGLTTINSITFHIIVPILYSPRVIEVGPGRTYSPTDPNPFNARHAIQRALDDAATQLIPPALVVVYPGAAAPFNPFQHYNENIIMHSPVKLQGVGPGGIYAVTDSAVPGHTQGTYEPGAIIDGTGFGQDIVRDTDWATELASIGAVVQPATPIANMPDGEVVLVVAKNANQFTQLYKVAIDGFTIQGGELADFVAPVNDTGGGSVLFEPLPPDQVGLTQGGGIFAYAGTRYLQITNNIIRSNAGSYSGAIRFGTPNVGSNNLTGAHVAYNRIIANGGSNLAGAVGIFAGTNNYEIDHNDICGNFSAEYGGGISHFGLSPSGSIHQNRIYFNGSYDEGAGIMIAGEQPTNINALSPGSGAVDVYNNLIQSNLANDDGGGLRFLQAGNFTFNVYNNFIVNNISTHEGGGVALDDAPNVRFYNNTVMKNITTATAVSSDGSPAPAGLSTMRNSNMLQVSLPAGSPIFSNPFLFNNIFWDNRAGRWDGANVIGIGGKNIAGQTDPNPINYWDLAVIDGTGVMQPTNSILRSYNATVLGSPSGTVASSATNKLLDPLVKSTYDTSIIALPFRGDAHFVGNVTISIDVPVTIMGDYHLSGTASPANNAGVAFKCFNGASSCPNNAASRVNAPNSDYDNQPRPSSGGYEMGADEISTAPVLAIAPADVTPTVAPSATLTPTVASSATLTATVVVTTSAATATPTATRTPAPATSTPARIAPPTATRHATATSTLPAPTRTLTTTSSLPTPTFTPTLTPTVPTQTPTPTTTGATGSLNLPMNVASAEFGYQEFDPMSMAMPNNDRWGT